MIWDKIGGAKRVDTALPNYKGLVNNENLILLCYFRLKRHRLSF